MLRATNNIYSIYLVKHLGSLKYYSIYTEMYKIKGVFEYWDFLLTVRICGKNFCWLQRGWVPHPYTSLRIKKKITIFTWTFIKLQICLSKAGIVRYFSKPHLRWWTQWVSGKQALPTSSHRRVKWFSRSQQWSWDHLPVISQIFETLLWSPLSQWRMPQDDCLSLF